MTPGAALCARGLRPSDARVRTGRTITRATATLADAIRLMTWPRADRRTVLTTQSNGERRQTLKLPRSTIESWIAKAREAGYLGEAEAGRVVI